LYTLIILLNGDDHFPPNLDLAPWE